MPDPMFDSLRQPAPVTPPDLGVIRRRGEQRKRRTALAAAVGALAVVAAVVVPVAALTGGDQKSAPDPMITPSPTQAANGAWVHRIPDTFPLGDGVGMPGEATATMKRGAGTPLPPCADGQSTEGQSGWADVATATNGDVVSSTDVTKRLLALYADASSAKDALDSVVQMYAACPPGQTGQTGPGPMVAERFGAQDAWVVTVGSESPPVGAIVTIERVGNALLVQQDALKPTSVRSRDQQLADVRAGQAQVVADMCIFAAEACATPPTVTQTVPDQPTGRGSSVAHVDESPASSPIPLSNVDPASDGVWHPPSDEGDPVLFGPCGVEAFALPSQDQLFFQVVGPEYGDTRELRTYPSAADAEHQMARLRVDVSDCPRDPSTDPASLWGTHDVDTGYDSFAAAQTYEQGLGGGVWLFTRVGRAILAQATYGEFSTDNVWDSLLPMQAAAKRIGPSMCLFTAAGC
jgi:hypothetical protein